MVKSGMQPITSTGILVAQVGAPGDNDRGDFSGAVYVFLRKADTFTEQASHSITGNGGNLFSADSC